VRPLEHRRFTRQCAFNEAARPAKGWRAVGLVRGADLVRAAGEQHLAAHLEKSARIVVDIDEFTAIDVEYDDHLGGVLHQRPVPRLAFADRLLGEMSFGDVADTDDVAVAPVELGLADCDLHRDAIAALDASPSLMRRQIHVRVVDLGGETLEKVVGAACDVGEQEIERAAQDLRR
jgi:hypothetical protein